MERLKPCPFCGGKVSITYNSGENAYAVWHTKEPCFIEPLWISGDDARTLNEAYAFWNRRDDVPDRNVGEWIKNEDRYGWHCSACGEDDLYAFAWNSDTGEDELQDRYCPKCGARMDGKEQKSYDDF